MGLERQGAPSWFSVLSTHLVPLLRCVDGIVGFAVTGGAVMNSLARVRLDFVGVVSSGQVLRVGLPDERGGVCGCTLLSAIGTVSPGPVPLNFPAAASVREGLFPHSQGSPP